jgi:hypothetical protein
MIMPVRCVVGLTMRDMRGGVFTRSPTSV